MQFDELMAMFAEKMGLVGLEPDGDGAYHIGVDGMAVSFGENRTSEEVFMLAEVGLPPPEGREQLFRTLLRAMRPGGAMDGLVFSCGEQDDVILMHRRMSLPLLDAEDFMTGVETFVNQLELWRRLLADFSPLAASAAEARQADEEARRALAAGGFMQV